MPDPAGFFVVYPDRPRGRLILEHYTTQGVLDCVLEGKTPAALYSTAVERGLVTRFDHAAYLGQELARAQWSIEAEGPYIQDAAAGDIASQPVETSAAQCGCGTSCVE